jgi:hypothetical protein
MLTTKVWTDKPRVADVRALRLHYEDKAAAYDYVVLAYLDDTLADIGATWLRLLYGEDTDPWSLNPQFRLTKEGVL